MKGALVEIKQSAPPNIIVFQFNPETLRHNWTQAGPTTSTSHPLAASGVPGERFSFTLSMEVTDAFSDGNPMVGLDAAMNGIYSRLAALEMLMFPTLMPGLGPNERAVPASQVPFVLFVWGAGRIVPVRVTGLTITEKLFDDKLNPTHAEASIELRVVTLNEIDSMTDPFKTLARAAYNYTQGKRVALAVANLVNTASSIELPPLPGI